MKILLSTLALCFLLASETIINTEQVKEFKVASTRMTHFAKIPNNKNEIIVATDQYAYKVDLVSGKTTKKYKHENSQTGFMGVYYINVDPTGQFLCSVDVRGERHVWHIESGKEEVITDHNQWIPTYRGLRDWGFNIKNNEDFYIYLQKEAQWDSLTIHSRLNRLEVMDGAKVLQRIDIESNNGSHYPPIMVRNQHLLVGGSKGSFFEYPLKPMK